MPSTRLRRSLAAVLTALACVALMATPAAAVTHDADITGGQITFTKTGVTEVFDLVPATCTAPTIQLDVTGTAVTATALGLATHTYLYPTLGTALAVFTRATVGNSPGTLNGTTLTSMRVMFMATVYNTSSCTPTGTPVCTVAFLLQLSGTLTGTGVSDTFSLTGNTIGTTVAAPTCLTGPSYILGTSGSVTSPITGHLTT